MNTDKLCWVADALGMSVAGMTTSRGQLMSTILFPAPMVFKYDEELPIVIALMILYAIPCAVCTIAFQYSNGSYSEWPTKFVYCMGIVNQCLNPLLPVVLTIGDVQAVRRLKVCTSYYLPLILLAPHINLPLILLAPHTICTSCNLHLVLLAMLSECICAQQTYKVFVTIRSHCMSSSGTS